MKNLQKAKQDVKDIKSMMNEIMQIAGEKETITKEIGDEEVKQRFKDVEKVILPLLYNLGKSDENYIYWPNRKQVIEEQINKILQITRTTT